MINKHNLLSDETSPYLLQHANNPVNWHPWNAQALQKAIDENKPILLSIGYSACHWCHVMAHESFEDESTAAIMNEHFINIKVDREERPDLDKIYQSAHSLLTSRSGGWPLTVFLSPDNQMPFFAGTYFPDKPRYNMPSFSEIMQLVSDAYNNKKPEIQQQDIAINNIFKNLSDKTASTSPINALPLDLARKQLKNAFESSTGGFGGAPKFPHPDMIERCLRHFLFLKSQDKDDPEALHMASFTLNKMAQGGFTDQIGGGFFRYSTDEHWMIPHFEKMLYDNGQLLSIYSMAYLITDNPLYKQTATMTADWVIREMQSSEGGYCSALDADTEKVEGKSYVWNIEQLEAILNKDELILCTKKYGLTEPANFEDSWHLHSTLTNKLLAELTGMRPQQVDELLESARNKLLAHRNQRPQPGRDDKILCAWNALMIKGMSQVGRRTSNQHYIQSAIKSADFIHRTLWNNQRLLSCYKDGKAHLNAYLDDYAFLLQALIELLQSHWSIHYYQWAIEIADSLLAHFEDKERGGFYFTSHDHEQLIYRSKTFSDDAIPNGNSVSASALLQLGLLSGQPKYLEAAEKTIRCCYNTLNEQAISHCSLLHSLELLLTPGLVIILRGDAEDLSTWKNVSDKKYITNLICIAIENDTDLPIPLEDKKPVGNICAYICEGTQCLPVITDFNEYVDFLKQL